MRTVVLEHQAEKSLRTFEDRFPRFADVYEGLEWLLARNPESFGEELGRNLHLTCRTSSIEVAEGTPGIAAVFSYTEDEVRIYDLMAVLQD